MRSLSVAYIINVSLLLLFSMAAINKYFLIICALLLIIRTIQRGSIPKIRKKELYVFLIFAFIIINTSLIRPYLYYLASFIFLFFVSILIYINKNILEEKPLNGYALVHISIFIIQVIYYEQSGNYLNIYELINVSDEGYVAYHARELEYVVLGIRAGGVYSEPSFLFIALLPVMVYKLIIRKFDLYFYATILTSLLTLSVAAAVIIGSMALITQFERQVYLKKLVIPLLLLLFFYAFQEFFYYRVMVGETYDAIGSRLMVFKEFTRWGIVDHFFGRGFFLDEFGANGVTNLSAAGVRDTGFLVYLYYASGIVGSLLFIYLLLNIARNVRDCIILLLALFSKVWLLAPSLFLMLIIVKRFSCPKRKRDHISGSSTQSCVVVGSKESLIQTAPSQV